MLILWRTQFNFFVFVLKSLHLCLDNMIDLHVCPINSMFRMQSFNGERSLSSIKHWLEPSTNVQSFAPNPMQLSRDVVHGIKRGWCVVTALLPCTCRRTLNRVRNTHTTHIAIELSCASGLDVCVQKLVSDYSVTAAIVHACKPCPACAYNIVETTAVFRPNNRI